MLGFLTEYLINADEEEATINPYICALAIAICSFISLAMGVLTYHIGWLIALNVKVTLTGAIYQKVSYYFYV